MTENILISVIIPVYNGKEVLSGAIESVLAQTAGDNEIILVNDGSTDGSGGICDAYARKHDRVRAVHKENGGISSARNAGIAAARGEYIAFVDADDYLDPDACAQIGTVIRAHHPDCISFGWKYVSRSGVVTANQHKIRKNVLLGADVLRDEILPPLLNLRDDPDHFIYDFSCTKVFRADIIKNNRIRFDENRRVWEDRPFVVQYLRFCRSFYAMDRCLYNYMDMPGSLSRRYSMDFFRIILENYQLYRRLFGDDYDFDTEYVRHYWSRAVENMIFRSFEEKNDQERIHRNMLQTLENDQVIAWFTGRKPRNAFEQKVSGLIGAKRGEAALRCYRRQYERRSRQEKSKRLLQTAARILKKASGVKS